MKRKKNTYEGNVPTDPNRNMGRYSFRIFLILTYRTHGQNINENGVDQLGRFPH